MSVDEGGLDGGQAYDSDKDFEKPKDEFMFYYQAFKPEEKKMVYHTKFEQITAQYWQLLRNMPEQDINKNTVSQKQYTELMKRIYKVLLPLYREDEMVSEISQEWIMDSRGQSEITQALLTKVLYRVAHWWATNIDIDEYIDLLTKIYQRITCRNIVLQYDYQAYPVVVLTFPQDEKKLVESGGKVEKAAFSDDWMECRSDESNKSDQDYKYEEDPDNMVVKKYKRAKAAGQYGGSGGNNANLTIKEPFVYNEEVTYPNQDPDQVWGCTGGSYYMALASIDQIFPFGYAAEQFLKETKQDVYSKIQDFKAANKANFLSMTKEQREGDSGFGKEQDTGLLEENGAQQEMIINAVDVAWGKMSVKITDTLYNTFRRMLKDGVNLTLRMYTQYPKPGQRTKARSSLNASDPILELNKFGYNPALERRVALKYLPNNNYGGTGFINVNYMLTDSSKINETAYRCDVNRIETKGKMALKESDEIKKDEEFVNVETSYKKLRQIMLFKKFESIFNERSAADNKEQKRLKKAIEKEDKRKLNAQKVGNIAQKGLSETYEEKSFIKMMRGPFFQLDSKEGLLQDDFYTCAEQDLIEAARTTALRILVIGKPRSGKTLLAKNLSIKLDLVHINIDIWIQQLLTKIKNYEPPEDLEEGQEPPKYLSDLEEGVYQALQSGSGPNDDQIVEILRVQIHSPQAVLKGFILDLSYYPRESSWASTIRQRKLLGEHNDGKYQEFSHVIELWVEDEDVRLRAEHMRVNPDDGNLYSRWEREERKKPKPVSEDDEQVDDDDENAIKPLDENALIQRPNDMDERIKEELQYYNTVERPAMEELLINFYDNQYIKLDSAGMTPDELTESVSCRIKVDDDLPLRPLAILIEGGANDYKSLLTEGVEENELPRKWSLWKQVDPVALFQGKVIQGLPENACHYNGNVFVFATEENLKAFIDEPKKYLQERPSMPSIFRVLMLGARGTGKHTQAQLLSDIYGWRVVDFPQLVRSKLEEMMKLEIHIPNNPMQGGRIGLSEQELQEVVEGKALPAWKYIPWILDYLGYELEKRKPPPPEEKVEDPDEDIDDDTRKKREAEAKKKAIEEEKKRKEEEELQRQKEERHRRREEARNAGLDLAEVGLEESEEEPIIIEDLSIDQLVLKVDEATGQAPLVGGFILIGFPETEEQINRLKAHGIEFDRIIYLQDTNEEDPGQEVKKRMSDVELYDFDWELENSQRILGLAKEHLGEDFVREISCNGDQDTVLIRLRNEIDPFYLKIDNPDDVRVSADLGEEDKKLPKGDFGDYCPITYVQDNWIVRGNPEQEVTVNGKTYWLSGEKEAELFKFNPRQFLTTLTGDAYLPLQPPPPKIMILGHRGSGVTTIQRMLCDKFKLDELTLKSEYLNKLKEEKEKRKRRRLLDRGFRPPLPPDEEGMEPPPDPEIEDDPEDFDKEGHEREVMKMVYDSSKGYVIDGSWSNLPEGAVNQNLQDLLFESRRVPEIVIILKCKEQNTFSRIIDEESIKAEYERLMENRAAERKKLRDEDREKQLEVLRGDEEKTPEDIEQDMAKWEEDRDAEEEAADENDPEKPNLEEMLEKERETLRESRTNDDAFFEEFSTALKDKQVFVIDDIKSDTSAEFVFIKLLDRIKDNFQFRKDLIERQLAQPLKPEEVKFFEKSYVYKHSKYGINSPISLGNPIKTKKHAVLYRERIYFLTDAEQQAQFLKEPAKFTQVETIPLDIQVKPKLFIIEQPRSGKSTLCKTLAEKTGIIHLKMSKVIQEFMDKDSIQGELLRRLLKSEGRAIEDDLLVSILLKRIQYKDCYTNGFILEDFPKTRNQALFLAKRGLVPSQVIHMKQLSQQTYNKNREKQTEKFGRIDQILAQRIKYFQENTPNLLAFYQKLYNNVVEIDSLKSKWFIEDRAFSEIQNNLEARQNFARDYHLKESRACKVKNMSIDRYLLKQAVSEFRYFCPVTWRNDKLLVKCQNNPEDCVLFKNCFYYFKSQRERDMFISNPGRFLQHTSLPKQQELPLRMLPHKAAEVVLHEKALNGHCSVTLMDEDRVTKGDQILLICYKDGKYTFASEFKLQRFLSNPFKYSKATLPVKMPPPEDKVSLYNLQRMDDSIAFMEQSIGQIVTRGLREVSDNRLKYPTLSVKETMLKLFALFLKTENPANTESMKKKYADKMKTFIQRCELPEELYDLATDKEKKKPKDQWPQFKENYYNDKGAEFDGVISTIDQEKVENFTNYIR